MAITVCTSGGIGNQLFQYTMGFSQATRLGVDLQIDNSRNGLGTFRPYNLSLFPNVKDTIVESQIPSYIENGLEYHPEVNEDILDGEVILGYWQSEKYFAGVANLLRKKLQLYISGADNPWPREAMEFLGKVMAAGERATFVGVRRGDYLQRLAYHGVMPEAYYTEAINAVKQSIGVDPVLFIFSDEPDWVENNWEFPYETHIFKNKPTLPGRIGREDIDLAIMKMCKNAIIANSSFHWWGAWLGNVNTIVAPATWFTDKYANSQDIVPERWLKI